MNEYSDERFSIKIEGDIVHVTFKQNHLDYKLADDGINIRKEMTKGGQYLMFSDARKMKTASREARERMSEKDAGADIIAVAILVESSFQRIMFNFFHSIYKAPKPTKLFTNKEKALVWLNSIKRNQNV
jgi:hypothetical protein